MKFLCMIISAGMLILSNPSFALFKHQQQSNKINWLAQLTSFKTAHASPKFISGNNQLAAELNQIIKDNETNANIAVYVKSMKSGAVLYSRNINTTMVPASTLKVLTAEAALIFLGANYRFATQLLTDAPDVKDGVLQGNLYIALSGDPTLTYTDIVAILSALKLHQIQSIAGNVYIDNSAYDQHYYGPGWDDKDKGYCYAAPIGASIINKNCLTFKIAPGRGIGKNAEVVTYPKYFYPTIRNSVLTKTTRTKNCALRLTTTPDKVINVAGCMPQGLYEWGVSYVITDIPEYNRKLFKNLIKRLGITVNGSVSFAAAPKNASIISQHASKPLTELISEMLKKSDNVIAGALFKKIGQLYTKQPGSWENGSYAVAHILASHAGMNNVGLRLLDGSGLSPQNLMTSVQMMQVLDFAYHHPQTSGEFIAALPVAGVDGTLKHRMNNIARKVRAKTGTISGVVALAGYADSADNEAIAFVIIINGHKGLAWQYRGLEDQIVTALTKYKN